MLYHQLLGIRRDVTQLKFLLTQIFCFPVQLERMKNENSLVLLDDKHFDPKYPGLQREMMQLHKVNSDVNSHKLS